MQKTTSARAKDTTGRKPQIEKLTGKHFIAWIRRQIREHGKGFEIGYIGDHCGNPVEAWLSDLGFEHVSASSMLELRVDDREFAIVPNGSFMDFLMFCDSQPDEESDWSLWTETEGQVYYRPITAKECLQAALDNINPEATLVVSEPKQAKHVDMVARYFLKAALAIVYVMINGGGKRYMVTIHANGTSSCVEAETGETCEGCHYGHVCYHKKAAFEAEKNYQEQVAHVERCDCHPHALHSKADHAMMESVGAAPPVLTRTPVKVVQEVVQLVFSECPVSATIMPTVCPQSATVEEEFSEEVAAQWIEEELSTPLSREAYVALFDPNYEACYA